MLLIIFTKRQRTYKSSPANNTLHTHILVLL